jgi:hypothetical protein
MYLRRRHHELAMEGDRTMLIWLGRQRLGQGDKVDSRVEDDSRVSVRYIAK